MAETIYASFEDLAHAKSASGALLDRGVKAEQLSLITRREEDWREEKHDPGAAERSAEKGITTTTVGDATSGAVKGGAVGLGVGALAAVASLVVPGFGLVVGGGALATAIAGALGTTAAGAVSGGALGYLKDQGVEDEVARKYEADLEADGALLSVDLPAGEVTTDEVYEVLRKYNARNLHTARELATAGTV